MKGGVHLLFHISVIWNIDISTLSVVIKISSAPQDYKTETFLTRGLYLYTNLVRSI